MSAEKTSCASNLRQIYIGVELFTQQYGSYPNMNATAGSQPSGVWAKKLDGFLPINEGLPYGGAYDGKSVFICPARVRQFPDAPEARKAASYGFSNYFAGIAPWTNKPPVSPINVTHPARTILIADGVWSESGRYPFQNIQFDMVPGSIRDRTSGGGNSAGTHGDGAANIIYADGHLEWFEDTAQLQDLQYRDWGPRDLWHVEK
ncbi:hypothetical protein SH580_02895 [Coraliomargarita algicola]|uniref:DUF1559 domain-containing protein n=1 Tax=Coraliomargarita algicola TaxID=3092156 RepID=A0ABZ0RUL8_9BACT|nr:hypothetical protein [Coraliomargarita sp. J2-16]WPJ96649.1 hypothetical protein SH580_02895 [Coraliomargarita sp. J2-16]